MYNDSGSFDELDNSKKEFNKIMEELKKLDTKNSQKNKETGESSGKSKVIDYDQEALDKKTKQTDQFDRLSSASMKSFYTMSSSSLSFLSKDNIIFKKYV